jgi:septum formation protein
MPALILGSASPRRAELLARLGVAFSVDASAIAEQRRGGEEALAFARRMAREKALAVAAAHPGAWVLGADTIVVVDGDVLGKPADAAEAAAMLHRLAGRVHLVVTCVALLRPGGALQEEIEACTEVEFRSLSAGEIERYARSEEPLDKAGGYGIQGAAGAFVAAVRGSYDNVVGLPTEALVEVLRRAGLLAGADRT